MLDVLDVFAAKYPAVPTDTVPAPVAVKKIPDAGCVVLACKVIPVAVTLTEPLPEDNEPLSTLLLASLA